MGDSLFYSPLPIVCLQYEDDSVIGADFLVVGPQAQFLPIYPPRRIWFDLIVLHHHYPQSVRQTLQPGIEVESIDWLRFTVIVLISAFN